jgi:hypothetical protein
MKLIKQSINGYYVQMHRWFLRSFPDTLGAFLLPAPQEYYLEGLDPGLGMPETQSLTIFRPNISRKVRESFKDWKRKTDHFVERLWFSFRQLVIRSELEEKFFWWFQGDMLTSDF